MSNSQNKKNEQQNNLCTTLTEQWRKGELESGWYYVKGADGLIGMMSDYALYRVNLEHPDNEITLLAKMPTYEEWKNVTTCFDYEHKAYLSMVEENQQLRKWCEEFNALDVAKENQRLQMSLRMTVDDYKNVVDICEQLKELLYSLKCCLASENIEPQIRVEKSLAKIEEFLTDGK